MNIADNLVTVIFKDTLNSLTDDGRTKMSYVKRLGNVSSAVIKNNCRLMSRKCHAKALLMKHLYDIVSYEIAA